MADLGFCASYYASNLSSSPHLSKDSLYEAPSRGAVHAPVPPEVVDVPVDPVAAVLEVGDGLGDHPGHHRVLHPAGPVQQGLHDSTGGWARPEALGATTAGGGHYGLPSYANLKH